MIKIIKVFLFLFSHQGNRDFFGNYKRSFICFKYIFQKLFHSLVCFIIALRIVWFVNGLLLAVAYFLFRGAVLTRVYDDLSVTIRPSVCALVALFLYTLSDLVVLYVTSNWWILTLTKLPFLTLSSLGATGNPEPVKPWLWNFAWVWYDIRAFKKY